MLSMAQTAYKLTDMSLDEFKQGGTQGFSFQQYTSPSLRQAQGELSSGAAGGFTDFQLCGDSSTANYVDIYQVEYVGGKILAEIDGVEPNGENTWASNLRTAWYNHPFEAIRTDSKQKFVYVAYDPREGYGMEINANDEYASAISFTAPADGYYRFNGKVIRVDNSGDFGSLNIVPMFRYGIQPENIIRTPMSFNYGFTGGAWEEADGNFRLADGGTRRYVAEQPTAFTFTVQAKKGDIISFVESCENTGVSNSFARAFMARSFMQQLDATVISAEEAAAAENYLNPYEEVDIDALYDYLDSIMAIVDEFVIGDGVGEFSQESIDKFYKEMEQVYQDDDKGLITVFTIDTYYTLIDSCYKELLKNVVQYDLSLEGNYALVNTAKDGEGNDQVVTDHELMAQNEDQPWGFFRHDIAGNYYRLTHHDESNKSGESAWYQGTNDWFYITDNGAMHPTTSQAPAITFTAPADGVYRLVYGVYRPSPNTNVENPLYIRNFYHKEGLQSLAYKSGDQTNAIYSQQFGSVKNDGQSGKAPIKGDFFVNMKQGDVITTELDCYTTGRNSSAGTQITRLYLLSKMNDEEAYTIDYAKQSGLFLYNPYAVGDATLLQQAISDAVAAAKLVGEENIGEGSGKYSQTAYEKLMQMVEEGRAACEAAEQGDASWDQAALDRLAGLIQGATTEFNESRIPYEFTVEGAYAIQLDGTDKYLTKKNKASGSYCYANFYTYDQVKADMDKNITLIDDYTWTFTFHTITMEEGTGAHDETTGDEIMAEVKKQVLMYGDCEGYVGLDGYVNLSSLEADYTAVHLYKYNEDDEVFAISTRSGEYWMGSFSWKSPYDKVNTSNKPQYIFRLSTTTLEEYETGIATTSAARHNEVQAYYSLDGRRLTKPSHGIVIMKMTDGSVRKVRVCL